MGLPNIFVNFEGTGQTLVERSARGTVCLILEEATASVNTYTSYKDAVEENAYTTDNYKYIQLAFLNNTNKVVVVAIASTETIADEGLEQASKINFDYLAVPTATTTDNTAIVTWVGAQRALNKIYKAVLANSTADKEYIINFATANIVTSLGTFSTAEYCCRIAGVLASLSLDKSATYYKLTDVISITESTDPDEDINAGELILINDGLNIKIARAVNSLTTTTTTKTAEFKKIKIIEGMDTIKRDIKNTFENTFIGQYVNNYDNQVILISAINTYFKALQGSVLDNNHENIASVDLDAQRQVWTDAGVDVSGLNDLELKLKTYASNVYLTASLKFLDAIEDLTFNISLV
jgi:hypothetical protein